MRAVLSYSNILYMHVYAFIRIKYNRYLRSISLLQHAKSIIPKATGKESNSSPRSNFGGEELRPIRSRQTTLLLGGCKILVFHAWHCLIMEKKAGRKWVVKVDDDSLIHPSKGWICDCGNWTFGNDDFHVPINVRVGRVRRGRVLSVKNG